MQVGGEARHLRAAVSQHVVDAGDEKLLVFAVFQVGGAGVGVDLLVLEVVCAADGVVADHLLFHRMADIAVRAVLQVAVGGRVACESEQRTVRAVGEIALVAEVVEAAAEEKVVAVVEEQRL